MLITGGSSGIGKALAFRFATAGWNVVFTGRNAEKVKEVSQQLKKSFPSSIVKAYPSDVGNKEDVNLIADILRTEGIEISVLINNAGISMKALFHNSDLLVQEELMRINYFGPIYFTKAFLPDVLKNKGAIINISSIAGIRPLPGRTAYSASKAALVAFMDSLRVEHLNQKLHVLNVFPGYTSSNIRNVALNAKATPQGESSMDETKMMSSETVAEEVFKAFQKGKTTLVLTSQGKLTVFLQRLFPRWMDKMVYNFVKKEKDSLLD